MEILTQLEAWHWVSVGVCLLLLEVLGTGGFLLGIGLAALLVAVMKAISPDLSWQAQFFTFSVTSVVLSLLYWRFFKPFNEKTNEPMLNDRLGRLIGRKVAVFQAIKNGIGKVQIEDALWVVSCDDDIEEGQTVEIVGASGMTLIVKPVN